MRISQLVSVLNDLKENYGGKHIWKIEGLEYPLPDNMEVELASTLKRTSLGVKSGKANKTKEIKVLFEYEGEVNLVDRSIWGIKSNES